MKINFLILFLLAFLFISCTPEVDDDNYSIEYSNDSRVVKQVGSDRNYLAIDANYFAKIYKNERFMADSSYKKLTIFLNDYNLYSDDDYHLLLQKNYFIDTLLFTTDSLRFYISDDSLGMFKLQLTDSLFTYSLPADADSLAKINNDSTVFNSIETKYLEFETLTAREDSLAESYLVSDEFFKSIKTWLENIADDYME